MAVKKSELYGSIWRSCDELRGGMDASQYKDYVLALLFVKYISDKYADVPFAEITIPKGASFKDMVALKGKPTIGDDINKKILAPIAEANQLSVSEMPDFNDPDKLGSGKDMVDRLTNLITIFESPALDFSRNRADGDDLLGDAYEYLMRNFATESGKSKGNFYTPAEVSRIIAKVIGITSKVTPSTTVYDPTCGSGSLLLKVADESERGMSIYGQEMDVATAALARMNMIIHRNAGAEIYKGTSTLSSPQTLDESGHLKTFDFVVANPPFSYKSWTNGFTVQGGTVVDPHERFTGFGVPPRKNGDYAFLLHIVRSMKSKGKGAVILPHGVLFRGNAEAEIRRNLIQRGYIKGIIGLPPNLFYGTGIPACIIVLDKENAENRKGIFMIDASKGFTKDGNKNRLREQDIHKVVDVFNRQIEIDRFSRMVPVGEIEQKEFNLNIPRYIDTQEPEDRQDIEGHLKGGIPDTDIDDLAAYWDVCPSLRKTLFAPDRKGYSRIAVAPDQVREVVLSNSEFVKFTAAATDLFAKWRKKTLPLLRGISPGDKPKKLIATISEDLLKTFPDLDLLDEYDIYQHLLTYWNETMQDDVYELVADGWDAGREIEYDTKKKKEWEALIIPKQLVTSRYFAADQKAIEKLEAERDELARQLEELVEEHGGDEGLLTDVINEKGKITKAALNARIREIKDDQEFADELQVLTKYSELSDADTLTGKKIKEAQAELEKKLLAKYKSLTAEEIQVLVVEDKWLAHLEADVRSEVQRVGQKISGRVKELSDRYNEPLPELASKVKDLEGKANVHLKKMGFAW